MSALNKTESQIWRQYTNLSLLFLSLSPNCYYDHVLFFRPSLWLLMRYSFDTWKVVLEFVKEQQFYINSHIILVEQKYLSTC